VRKWKTVLRICWRRWSIVSTGIEIEMKEGWKAVRSAMVLIKFGIWERKRAGNIDDVEKSAMS
jgi:hypothetical protein